MRLTGPLLLAFIVFHVLHLTTGTVHPDYHEEDVYQNLISGLSVVWVSVVYVLAMAMLGFHLWHGVWSLFQTLGGEPGAVRVARPQARDRLYPRRRPRLRRGPAGGPRPARPLVRWGSIVGPPRSSAIRRADRSALPWN